MKRGQGVDLIDSVRERAVQSGASAGFVSETNIQINAVAAAATAAMAMNPPAGPIPWNKNPVANVLTEAAIPIIAPTAPCARLNRPVSLVRSVITMIVNT